MTVKIVTLCLLKGRGKSCEFQYKKKLGTYWKQRFRLCNWAGTCNQKLEICFTDLKEWTNQKKILDVQGLKSLQTPFFEG